MNNYKLFTKKIKKLSIINKILFVILIVLAVLSLKIIWFVIPMIIVAMIISNNKCILSDINKSIRLK